MLTTTGNETSHQRQNDSLPRSLTRREVNGCTEPKSATSRHKSTREDIQALLESTLGTSLSDTTTIQARLDAMQQTQTQMQQTLAKIVENQARYSDQIGAMQHTQAQTHGELLRFRDRFQRLRKWTRQLTFQHSVWLKDWSKDKFICDELISDLRDSLDAMDLDYKIETQPCVPH